MEKTPRSLRIFTKFTTAWVVFLLFAGAMVTSTDSGLAVPDWPLSYGQMFPPMKGGIFYEHGHRMVAAVAGMLTVVQAIWMQLVMDQRSVRILSWLAVGAVILQGLLGGLTVYLLLPTAVSVSHALLGEIYFTLHLVIALYCSATWERWISEGRIKAATKLSRLSPWIVVLVFLQVMLGAITRHLGAALAIPDFPLALGRIIPPLRSPEVIAHYSHRVGALVVTVMILAIFPVVRRWGGRFCRRLYGVAVGLVAVQITLGAWTVLSGRHPIVASLHLVGGALLLGTVVLLMLSSRYDHGNASSVEQFSIREAA